MAATEKLLGEVHEGMARWALYILGARDVDNKPLMTAAEASVIRAFLKDNDITSDGEEGTAMADLRKKLAERTQGRSEPPKIDPLLDLGEGIMQ